MDRTHPPHDEPQGLAPAARKWPVSVVLVIALVLMLAVPLVGRAFGASGKADYPGCAIAPWTGTCTCMTAPGDTPMAYDDFVLRLRQPGAMPRGTDPDTILANARQACRIDRPATRVARQ